MNHPNYISPKTNLGTGTRASKIQDGKDVDVLRSPGDNIQKILFGDILESVKNESATTISNLSPTYSVDNIDLNEFGDKFFKAAI